MTAGMRRGWLVATIVMLLLCLFMAWQSYKLSLVDRLGPGPGFFPFWLAAIGSVLAAAIFVQTLRSSHSGDLAPLFPHDGYALGRIAAIIGISALGIALMLPLGFRFAMLVFAVALVLALGSRAWLTVAAFGLLGSLGVYHVFNNWLDVVLPQGVAEQALGL